VGKKKLETFRGAMSDQLSGRFGGITWQSLDRDLFDFRKLPTNGFRTDSLFGTIGPKWPKNLRPPRLPMPVNAAENGPFPAKD
jgi:hypothetical protein